MNSTVDATDVAKPGSFDEEKPAKRNSHEQRMEEVAAKDAGELRDATDQSEDSLVKEIVGSTEHVCEDDAPADVESLNIAAQ